jgi:hypothetical protein
MVVMLAWHHIAAFVEGLERNKTCFYSFHFLSFTGMLAM